MFRSIQAPRADVISSKSTTIALSSSLSAATVISTRALWPCACAHLPGWPGSLCPYEKWIVSVTLYIGFQPYHTLAAVDPFENTELNCRPSGSPASCHLH